MVEFKVNGGPTGGAGAADRMQSITVRDAAPADEAAWRRLWAGYLEFYEASVPESVTAMTWRRILDPASPIFARIAEQKGQVAGFAVCVLHEGSWVASPICYLEDLFVDPDARGGGIATALIGNLIELGRARGWSRLYWHTRAGNAAARRVYDRFVGVDDFVRYEMDLR
jgi:GNAT superfamily N-acetyltransferase